ncbi:MAG: phosphate acetyltransferase, partial [Chitinispirillia bacterium]
MANNLYIAATEARSGKSAISLGIMEMLLKNVKSAAFFRPIIDVDETKPSTWDHDIYLINTHFKLDIPYKDTYAYTAREANHLLSFGNQEELFDGILKKYNAIAEKYDFVLCEGHEFEGATASFDFEINAQICNNMGCPLLLVTNSYKRSFNEIVNSVKLYHKALIKRGCEIVAIIVNRIYPDQKDDIIAQLTREKLRHDELIYAIPNEPSLGDPTIEEIVELLQAKVLFGEESLNRHATCFTVAAMELKNLIPRINTGTLIITPGDRSDVILGCLAALASRTIPNISGMVLTGGLIPEEPIKKVIEGFGISIPFISVEENTFETARKLDMAHAVISPENERKVTQAIAVFEKNVNTQSLGERIIQTYTSTVTPKMFEYKILERARKHKQHIVLPEGEDERILRATEIILFRDIAEITLLGKEERIREKATSLGLHLSGCKFLEPIKAPCIQDYVQTYFDLRKHKGITYEQAQDIMDDWNFFGTMMIYKGDADGMVSGAIHTTGDTIRPAFQFIKTEADCPIISSVFFMCLNDKVLVYGDCAVNPNPNAEQLAHIAISSAQTAMAFGIEPRVALLSYSTGSSGKGADVEIVREATRIAKELKKRQNMDILLEGPIQYDAAVDEFVARSKMPDSKVAGRATVFVFPDLNTGNNTYKAVQRSSGAIAIGPILQGLQKPVNDLSRGC